jgi:hypothetical protein
MMGVSIQEVNVTPLLALLLGLGLAGQAESTFCRNPPSRAADSYWDYIGACGCARLETPSRASSDYDRFLKACGDWRERNPGRTVALPDPTAGDPVTPASPPARECQTPPSRVSDSYWTFIGACGCASLTAPSRASAEYDRFVKACSDWRQRNPTSTMSVAGASPRPRPSPRPSPSASPKASPAP